jgi:RHS repeat-associated protein
MWHAQSGLNLTLFRAYDPNLGRWISRDPIHEAGGVNLYAYVKNDPIRFVDPYGLDRCYDPCAEAARKQLQQDLNQAQEDFKTEVEKAVAVYILGMAGVVLGVVVACTFGGPIACAVAQRFATWAVVQLTTTFNIAMATAAGHFAAMSAWAYLKYQATMRNCKPCEDKCNAK